MLKKNITYVNFDGEELTETFWFNLTKAELMKLEVGTEGSFTGSVSRIIKEQDSAAMLGIFESLILSAYGEKSADGKRFIKKRPDGTRLADEFAETEAYSQLFIELTSDPDKATAFFNGIIPPDTAQSLTPEKIKEVSAQLGIIE